MLESLHKGSSILYVGAIWWIKHGWGQWVNLRLSHLHAVHRCGLLLQMLRIVWSVCLSVCVGHVGDLCKNGLTDRNSVLREDLCEPKEPYIRWGSRPTWEGALLRAHLPAHCNVPTHECIVHCLPAAHSAQAVYEFIHRQHGDVAFCQITLDACFCLAQVFRHGWLDD